MKAILSLSTGVLAAVAVTSLLTSPAFAGPLEDGNLYGAAEACGLSTAGLPYYGNPDFDYGRQRARQSRQDCPQVANTLSRGGALGGLLNNLPLGGLFQGGAYTNRGNPIDQGNLFGAAEACGLSTAGLPFINSSDFDSARRRARGSRQDCAQVANTAALNTGQTSGLLNRPRRGNNRGRSVIDQGNLFGAAEACNIPTYGLPFSNNPDFDYARQRARNSRQDCSQVANTVSRSTGRY